MDDSRESVNNDRTHERANPSPATGVLLHELLPVATWHALAKAADVPADDVDAALSGGVVSARMNALVAYVGPAVWTLLAAREAVRAGAGLTCYVDSRGRTKLGALPHVLDAAHARVLLDGPDAFGIGQ